MCITYYIYLQHIRVAFIVQRKCYKKPTAIGNASAVKPAQYVARLLTL